jgi:hypothetical protein
MLYFLLFSFISLFSISSCCSGVACIVSLFVTLGIFRSTGNDSINSRASLAMFGFSSSILLLASSRSGKWKVLKDILRLYAAYNFDVIIDKEISLRDDDKFSVIRGGNKELVDGIREIMLQTRRQIGRFIDSGEVIWLSYISGAQYGYDGPENQHGDYLIKNNIDVISSPNKNPKTIYLVREKLDEIMMLLNPVEHGFSESVSLPPEVIRELSHWLEELFADEITALYYFHLYYDFEFYTRVSVPMKYYSSISTNNNDNNQLLPISRRPKNCLLSILKSDKEKPLISEWFYRWMQDITNLQNEIYGYLKLHT